MIKILHTSDLNIGADLAYVDAVANTLRQAQLTTLKTLVDQAIDHDVQLFVVAGNLFASHAPHECFRAAVLEQLNRLQDLQIRIVLLPGGGDHPLGSDSVYAHDDYSKWVLKDRYVQAEPESFAVNDQTVYLYALPWQIDSGESADLFMQRRTGDGIHIGLLHSHKLDTSQLNPYQENLICWRPALIGWNLDYVIAGNQFPDQLVDGENILAHCSGTPQGLSFMDCGSCYSAIVTIDDQRVQLTELETQSVRFERYELDISSVTNGAELNQRLLEFADRNLALAVKLIGTIEELYDWELLKHECSAAFAYLELADATSFIESRYVQQMAEEDTVRGIVCRRMVELAAVGGENQREIYEMALRELLKRFKIVGEAMV